MIPAVEAFVILIGLFFLNQPVKFLTVKFGNNLSEQS